VHNLAERPRDAPRRTAFGVAVLSWMFLIFAFGAADRIFVAVALSYNVQLFAFRVAIWVVPAILYVVTRRWCRALRAAEEVEKIRERAKEEIRLRQAG
jgi:ubiquinol-cytochrome c reductase cytochrome b subunit